MYLAIIPARSGSKRIKNKNIKIFYGYPIIRYSIHQALQSKLFKKIIVSTDSNRIKKIAIKYGASVPFLRTKNLSSDFTPINKVLLNVLKKIKKSYFPKYFCLIYATAPLIDKKDIIKSINFLKKNNSKAESIIAVCEYHLPIQRALKLNSKKHLEFINKKFAITRSQDLDKAYYDAGIFCWYNTKIFFKKKGKNLKTIPYVLKENKVQDIDTVKDWTAARFKFQLFKRNKKNKNF